MLEEMERILVPSYDVLTRTTALIQLRRDVRGDHFLIGFGLSPDKVDSLVDTSVTMPYCVRHG
jgi:predicted aspartyl protease